MDSGEHKTLNVVMYFVYIIFFWVVTAAFYLIFLRGLTGAHKLIILIGIELGACTVGMLLKMVQACTVNLHAAVPKIFYLLSYAAIYVGLQIAYNYFSDNISELTDQTPYWILTGCAIVTIICLIFCSTYFSTASVFSAFYPVLAIIVAVLYCIVSYYLTGWVVAKWEFDAETRSYLYFRLPSLIMLIASVTWIGLRVVWTVVRFVYKLSLM